MGCVGTPGLYIGCVGYTGSLGVLGGLPDGGGDDIVNV